MIEEVSSLLEDCCDVLESPHKQFQVLVGDDLAMVGPDVMDFVSPKLGFGFGEDDEQAASVDDPAQDCEDFRWCAFCHGFDHGWEHITVEQLLWGEGTTNDFNGERDGLSAPFDVILREGGKGGEQIVNEDFCQAKLINFWVCNHFLGLGKGDIIGEKDGLSNC